jgi:hypothetical protein
MSWFTDRPHTAAAASAKPWLPRSLASGGDTWRDGGPPPTPPLAFDESEMARMAAAMSLRARQDAQAACAADPAIRLAHALERMAEALADGGRRHAREDAAAMRRTVELAAAIARAAVPGAGDSRALADRIGEMLAGLDGPPAARLVVAPTAVDDLRPLLPELAARAGFAGGLELEPDPRLPEGAAQLLWPGGWLEHDPAALAARAAELLAAHGPQPPPAATEETDHEHDAA